MMAGGAKPEASSARVALPAAFERIGVGGGPHFNFGDPGHGVQDVFMRSVDPQQGVCPRNPGAVAQAVQVIDHVSMPRR